MDWVGWLDSWISWRWRDNAKILFPPFGRLFRIDQTSKFSTFCRLSRQTRPCAGAIQEVGQRWQRRSMNHFMMPKDGWWKLFMCCFGTCWMKSETQRWLGHISFAELAELIATWTPDQHDLFRVGSRGCEFHQQGNPRTICQVSSRNKRIL